MNLLDVQQFETYVSACARNSGVTVVWDSPKSTPRTDGKKMWLPALSSVTSSEWLTRMRYFVKHETSHIVYSDFDLLQKERPQGLLALINNLIEDHRIDYLNDQEYKGDYVISNDFWVLYCQDVCNNIKSEDKELTDQQRITLPLFIWDAMNRSWITSSTEMVHLLTAILDDVGSERLLKLLKYTPELHQVRAEGSGADVMELSKRILADVYDAKPEDYVQPEAASGDGGKADGDGGGEKSAEDGSTSKKESIINVDKVMEKLMHKHESSRTGTHMEVKFGSGGYVIPTKSEYRICYFDRPLPTDVTSSISESILDTVAVNRFITSNARNMANKLRIKLQTQSRDRYEYGKRKGTLHNGSLHRVLSTDDKHASKIFRKRIVSDTLDTAVCLLVDCSGSMSGSKFNMACAGAGGLAEALKPLNINYSIYGFTNTYDEEHPLIWMFTEYGERVSQPELISRFSKASGALMQNSDGDAIAYSASRLMQTKQKRKVLLVLSDGSPAGRLHAGDLTTYTKEVIKNAEKSGIDVYGIGIQDDNVRKFYSKSTVVNKLSDLAPTILSIVDRSI